METKQEVLQKCWIDGNVVRLPLGEQLDRKLYVEVAKALELIGGKWNRKATGFVFPHNPTELLAQIANGEKRNLKKEFQFFGTPAPLADKLVEMAEIKDGMTILEPSAGQGAIIKAIYKAFPRITKDHNDKPCVTVDYCELMETNNTILSEILSKDKTWECRTSFWGEDFLKMEFRPKYERIIANPPFAKNQDIDHIRKMYECLKTGGILVSICSLHYRLSSNKKETDFRIWLQEVNAEIIQIDRGAFKESGTTVGGVIIKIQKK